MIVDTRCSLSPGLMRSGEYPTKKSSLNRNPDTDSSSGTHRSSVAPGYTVDSYTTTSPGFSTRAIVSDADNTGERSGCLASSIGVGVVTMNTFAAASSPASDVNRNRLACPSSTSSTSRVWSRPARNSSTRRGLMS